MDVGIFLPATIPGVDGATVIAWAERADRGPFSSLGVIDRLVYPNFDPLITLAAAAAVTKRIRLMTNILIAPYRNTAVLAKEAATLDALSHGRLTLGLAVGIREDDYLAAETPYHTRGKRLDHQIMAMRRIWSGAPLSEAVGPIGPPPVRRGGPELLIGGHTPAAIARMARWCDGYIMGSGDADQVRAASQAASTAWSRAGRAGRPRFVGVMQVALGPDAATRGLAHLRDYYAFAGPYLQHVVAHFATTPGAIRKRIAAYAAIGIDEVLLVPYLPEVEQLDRLAALVA